MCPEGDPRVLNVEPQPNFLKQQTPANQKANRPTTGAKRSQDFWDDPERPPLNVLEQLWRLTPVAFNASQGADRVPAFPLGPLKNGINEVSSIHWDETAHEGHSAPSTDQNPLQKQWVQWYMLAWWLDVCDALPSNPELLRLAACRIHFHCSHVRINRRLKQDCGSSTSALWN